MSGILPWVCIWANYMLSRWFRFLLSYWIWPYLAFDLSDTCVWTKLARLSHHKCLLPAQLLKMFHSFLLLWHKISVGESEIHSVFDGKSTICTVRNLLHQLLSGYNTKRLCLMCHDSLTWLKFQFKEITSCRYLRKAAGVDWPYPHTVLW